VATTPSIHIVRDRFHLAWDPAIPPIETVPSGSIVTFDLLDASGGQLTATSTTADAQGDGEVCGTAIETPTQAILRLTARPDLHLRAPEFIMAPGPLAETPVGRRYATDGIGPDLLGAARDAVHGMIDCLGREHGLAAADAYLLCSVAIDLRISEIVDMPNNVVTAHCPLSIFD